MILVRAETSPDDVHGMARAAGILTSRGGLASHAAVVARGWGIPAVVGAAACRGRRRDGDDRRPVVPRRRHDHDRRRHRRGLRRGRGRQWPRWSRGGHARPGLPSRDPDRRRRTGRPAGAASRASRPAGRSTSATSADDDRLRVLAVKGYATPEALATALLGDRGRSEPRCSTGSSPTASRSWPPARSGSPRTARRSRRGADRGGHRPLGRGPRRGRARRLPGPRPPDEGDRHRLADARGRRRPDVQRPLRRGLRREGPGRPRGAPRGRARRGSTRSSRLPPSPGVSRASGAARRRGPGGDQRGTWRRRASTATTASGSSCTRT